MPHCPPQKSLFFWFCLFNLPCTLKVFNVCGMRDSIVPFPPIPTCSPPAALLPNGSTQLYHKSLTPQARWFMRGASSALSLSQDPWGSIRWLLMSDTRVRLLGSKLSFSLMKLPASLLSLSSFSSVKWESQEYLPPRVVVRITRGLAHSKCSGHLN